MSLVSDYVNRPVECVLHLHMVDGGFPRPLTDLPRSFDYVTLAIVCRLDLDARRVLITVANPTCRERRMIGIRSLSSSIL